MKRTKRQRLQEREEWLAVKVAQGHPCASVLKRWERDLKRTRAMLRALDDGRPAGAYPDYLERAGGVL